MYNYNTNQTFDYTANGLAGATHLSELGIVGTLGGGLTNVITGDTDYQRVLEQQGFQNSFEANQAELARKWQEFMSNTSYQRTVEDMKKAGLNPYLAYQNGASSTPSTSSPSGTGAQSLKSGNVISALVGSLVSGAFNIATQGMAYSAKSALEANKNAYEIAKQSQSQDFQLHLANLNSKNAIARDEAWRKFYQGGKKKNEFRNSNDRKMSDEELQRMFDDLVWRG